MLGFRNLLADFMKINPVQRQSLLSFGSLLAVTGLGYIATFYFAHYLGAAVLGSYFLFLAYYGVFDLIGDGGFGGAAVKRISEGSEQSEYFTAYVILRIILLSLSVVVFILISPYLTGLQDRGLLFFLIIALMAGTAASITGSNLYGTAQVGIMQISNLLNTIAKNLVQILAVFIGYGLFGLVAGFIAGTLVSILVNLKFIQLGFSRCNRSHFSGLLSFSIWTFLSSGGALVFTYADTILIGLFMSETDVGIYRVAYQLSSVASFIVLAFHTVLFPRISRWHAENNLSLIEFSMAKAFMYSLLFTIPITVGGILLSGSLLYYLYGASFVPGTSILAILLFVQVVNIFMFLLTMCLNAMDMPKTSFSITAGSALLNILLNLLLIPRYGIAGAATASLVTISINAALAYAMLRPVLSIRVEGRGVLNLILSALLMAVVIAGYTYLIPIRDFAGLVLVIGFGAGIYFAAVLCIDNTIRNELKGLLDTMHLPIIP